MADYDLSTITASLEQKLKDRVIRTANTMAPTLRFLRSQKGSGKNAAWVVESTGSIGENFTDGADVSNYGVDTPNFAKLDWSLYRSNFKITDLAAATAGTSMTPADLVRLMARQMINSARKLASTLNGVAYSGAGTGTTVAGLALAIADSGTYAGIDRTSATYWRAKVVDPGSLTDPSIALIRSDLGAIYDQCGEYPDIALCSTSVWNKVANLFTELRRFNQEAVGLSDGRVITLDASVNTVTIDGCTFIKDKDATANAIYYLNSQYVYWEYLPFVAVEELMEQSADMALVNQDGSQLPLSMRFLPLARTGAARKVTGMVQSQLIVEKPSACGKRLNVAA